MNFFQEDFFQSLYINWYWCSSEQYWNGSKQDSIKIRFLIKISDVGLRRLPRWAVGLPKGLDPLDRQHCPGLNYKHFKKLDCFTMKDSFFLVIKHSSFYRSLFSFQKWDICFEKLQVVLEKEGRENATRFNTYALI